MLRGAISPWPQRPSMPTGLVRPMVSVMFWYFRSISQSFRNAAPEMDGLSSVPARRRNKAQAVRAGFELTPENLQAIVSVCDRLDGLPLAIELAAARCRIFSPDIVLGEVDR